MRPSTRTALIVVGAIVLAVAIALILYFTLRPKQQPQALRADASTELRKFIKDTFNTVLKIVSGIPLPIPDLYSGCSGSTINRVKFCGNLKYSGTIDIGGSVACSIPYNACRAPCSILCVACKLPFVPCGPCNSCERACKRIYDACNGATKAEWSVNVLEAFDIGNTMSVSDFSSFSVTKEQNEYVVAMKLIVAASPQANIDIRTTAEIGNYQGNIGLGRLKITVPLELVFDCSSRRASLRKLDKLQIDGINVQFQSTSISGKLKEILYNLVKSNIESTLTDTLQNKLTDLFGDFIKSELLPRLTFAYCV